MREDDELNGRRSGNFVLGNTSPQDCVSPMRSAANVILLTITGHLPRNIAPAFPAVTAMLDGQRAAVALRDEPLTHTSFHRLAARGQTSPQPDPGYGFNRGRPG